MKDHEALVAAAAKVAAVAEATKSTADKPPQKSSKPAHQPPPQKPTQEEVPPKVNPELQEGGDEFSGHFSAPQTSLKRPEYLSTSVTAPSKKFLLKRKCQVSPVMKFITSSPPKQ